MKIMIRSDASNAPNFGTGHLQRMNILSQHLKKFAKIKFLTRTQSNFNVSKKILSSEKIINLANDSLIYPNSAK